MKRILIFILILSFNFSFFGETRPLKIHFIDVGEGDAIFIEAPEGSALIDAGNLISGFKLSEYLNKNNVQQLKYLIFTHPHLDHIGGAFFVVQKFTIENIYDNGADLSEFVESQDAYRWYEQLVRKNSNYKILKAADEIRLGEAVLKVLWPKEPAGKDFNINSLVIMVEYRGFRCLLMADATAESERELLESGEPLLADILKVSHHGSSDASSGSFLKAVSPKAAIISVNQDNIRGYPSEETLMRLKSKGVLVYRTDKSGTVIVVADQEGKFWIEK